MKTKTIIILILSLAFVCSNPAFAVTTTVNAEAAWAVLSALQNPNLTMDEARKIGGIHGNRAVIRKLQEFKVAATEEAFSSALVAAAHGRAPANVVEQNFLFELVKPKIPQLTRMLGELRANPATFQEAIAKRIDLYSPSGKDLQLKGYIVAAGDGGGYAFGDLDFFINIGIIDELVVIHNVTAHELYHAVQGAFSSERNVSAPSSPPPKANPRMACATSAQLFDSLYREGSAVEVADVSMIAAASSPIGMKMRNELMDSVNRAHSAAILLEMSVVALSGDAALEYHEVYTVGFLGNGPLYGLGYIMAKAIVDEDGQKGLADFARRPAHEFFHRYLQLPRYGLDAMHPALGAHMINTVKRLARGCK